MSRVDRFTSARMKPGGAPGLIAAIRTERERGVGGRQGERRERAEINTCYTTGKETTAARATEHGAVTRSLWHLLDEEDPPVPAHTVRPVLR